MKFSDIFEALSRTPLRLGPANPDLMGKITSKQVVASILGDRLGDANSDDLKDTDIVLVRSWTGYDIFSTMDNDPGMGGAIGLIRPNGRSASDIATAAHEAFHALLQTRGKNYENEHVVNRLASRWLQDHFDGPFLHAALEAILHSKLSYKTSKFAPTREWLKSQSLY